MNICQNSHEEIIYNDGYCPLCHLTDHNNKVHDFIEEIGIRYELVEFQNTGQLGIRAEELKKHYKTFFKSP